MRTWPLDWEARKRGLNCPVCGEGRPDVAPVGERVFAGIWTDAYLDGSTAARGYTLVFWRGRHVSELTELTDDETAGYALELRLVARGVVRAYQPAKLNLLTLGNRVPHLHTHLMPRYLDDPDPERPPRLMMDDREWPPIPETVYSRQVERLRWSIANS